MGESVGVVGFSPFGIPEGKLTQHSVAPPRGGQLGMWSVVYNNGILIYGRLLMAGNDCNTRTTMLCTLASGSISIFSTPTQSYR